MARLSIKPNGQFALCFPIQCCSNPVGFPLSLLGHRAKTKAGLPRCTEHAVVMSERSRKPLSFSEPAVVRKSKLGNTRQTSISNQCLTLALHSETRVNKIFVCQNEATTLEMQQPLAPLFPTQSHCTCYASPCLQQNTIDLETRLAEDSPGESKV